AERRPVRVVLCEQIVEDRRAGPRLADDDEGPPSPPPRDPRMIGSPGEDPQPVGEIAEDVAGHDLQADVVQAGFRRERREQPVETLPPSLLAEVVEPGELPRLAPEPIGPP